MKYLFLLLIPLVMQTSLHGQSFGVMTYNIRYAGSNDGPDAWTGRQQDMVTLLKHYRPAIFGIQEGLLHQVEFLDNSMAQYAYIGVGRDDGQQKGEFSAIFYDTTRFSLVRQGTFWLSTQSERPSVGWDAMMERICTYGFFVHRASGRELLCLNTHFDHKGKKARRKSSRLILRKVKELNERGLPVIVMGDLNSEPESRPIALLRRRLADSFTLTERPPEGPAGTFNGFDLQVTPDRRIDYVLVTGFAVETYAHLDDRTRQGRYISDHLPVWVTLRFASPD